MTLLDLLAIAAMLTGTPILPELPGVEYQTQVEMRDWLSETRDLPEGSRIGAVYHEGTIHLPAGTDLTDTRHRSFVLHELVHHLQREAGAIMDPDPCVSPIEREAYAVQFAFLESRGIADPIKWLDMDPWLHLKQTKCLMDDLA